MKLDPTAGAAPDLQRLAIEKGLDRPRVFVADGQVYLLVLGITPEFESPSAEAVACHIEMLALQGGLK